MGILSAVGRFFKKLWRGLIRILKKIWPILLVIAAIVAIFFPAVLPAIWAALGSAWATVGSWVVAGWEWYVGLFEGMTFLEGAALALGTAFVLAPDETRDMLVDAGSAIGDAAGSAIGGVTEGVIAGTTSALAKSPFVWLGIAAIAAYFIFRNNDDEEDKAVEKGAVINDPSSELEDGFFEKLKRNASKPINTGG